MTVNESDNKLCDHLSKDITDMLTPQKIIVFTVEVDSAVVVKSWQFLYIKR